jgi:hypothetical protein
MKRIASMSTGERGEIFAEAGARLGFSPFHVEKDFWVCWTLAALFGDEAVGPNLAFRGGTSLSKGWQCIDRFSEDIDLAINRDWAGGGDVVDFNEEKVTASERERRFKKLRNQCRATVADVIVPLLSQAMSEISTDATRRIVVEPLESARDPFVVYVRYPVSGIKPPDDYFEESVKIELSGRAEGVPVEAREIVPYVHAEFAQLRSEPAIVVPCVQPKRTFWEKAALLHEQNTRPNQEQPANRQSRHLYDLHRLWTVWNLADVISAKDLLFKTVMDNRAIFFPYAWVSHHELMPGDLRLCPPSDMLSAWHADYEKMSSMFFGGIPSFQQVLATVREIQKTLNRS